VYSLVVHLPRRSNRAHNPYAVLFADSSPLVLYYLDKNLKEKNREFLRKLKEKYFSLKIVAKNSTIITTCGENPEKSLRYYLVSRIGKAVPVPEHLASINFPYHFYEKKEVDFAYKVLQTYLLMKRDLELLKETSTISVALGKPWKYRIIGFKVEDFKIAELAPPEKPLITLHPLVLENCLLLKHKNPRVAAVKYLRYLRNIDYVLSPNIH